MVSSAARDLLANALKRRDELEREREALDQIIATYQQLAATQRLSAGTSEEQPDLYRGTSPRAEHRARIEDTLIAARRIILEANRPMKRGELVRLLEQQGFELPGSDKTKVLGTNLWRSGLFETIEGAGYWPTGKGMPPLRD